VPQSRRGLKAGGLLHAQLGKADALVQFPFAVVNVHLFPCSGASPASMFVNLSKRSLAVLDCGLVLVHKCVGSLTVGMHGVNFIAYLVSFRIREVSSTGVSLSAKQLQVGPDMFASVILTVPFWLSWGGKDVVSGEGEATCQPFSQAQPRPTGVGNDDIRYPGRVGFGLGEESKLNNTNPRW
jgi:hypothetical protein